MSPQPASAVSCIQSRDASLRRLIKFPKDNLSALIPDLQIVIVGAGIGGLAAGIAFSRSGFTNVVIHESAPEIKEVCSNF